MKRIISLMIALMMALSVCAVSFADDPEETPGTVDMPMAGIRFVPPQSYVEAKGILYTDGAIRITSGIWYAYWVYCAMTEEELIAVAASGEGDSRMTLLYDIFSINDNRTFEDLNSMLYTPLPMEYVREIGRVGDVTFYLYSEGINQDYASTIDEAYRDEYMALAGATDEAVAACTFYEPADENAALIGSKAEFTAKDLDGNTVSSADLFAKNEITMVNIWATWCGPCVGELAELQKLHSSLQEKGCGVIGLLIDNDLSEARKLIAKNGVAYPVLRAPANLNSIFPVDAYPTTYFVNREGEILSAPVVGAYMDQYRDRLAALLDVQ